MRITIESTVSEPQFSTKIIKEVPYDDLLLSDLLGILEDTLKGYGYSFDGEINIMNDEELIEAEDDINNN